MIITPVERKEYLHRQGDNAGLPNEIHLDSILDDRQVQRHMTARTDKAGRRIRSMPHLWLALCGTKP